MNMRALKNFILLPCTSSSSREASSSYRNISKSFFKNCIFVLFFLTYVEDKHSRSSNTGEHFGLMLTFSLLFKKFKFQEQPFHFYRS